MGDSNNEAVKLELVNGIHEHCKVCEERKAEETKSLRLINFHGIPTVQENKEKIIFQTGSTGG